MQKRGYHVEEYSPTWIKKFEDIKERLEVIFGKEVIVIEHVGSTSIPGMNAKPIIDILIILNRWKDYGPEMKKMKSLGYECQENIWSPDSLLFFKTQNTKYGEEKTENIHVLVVGAPKIDQFIDERDFLRTHPEKANEYSLLKEKLSKKFPEDYLSYRDGKQKILREIEEMTKFWKKGNKTV